MKRLIKLTQMLNPKKMKRVVGFIVIVWFIQGVVRGRISGSHLIAVFETIMKVLMFLKRTVTRGKM